MSDYETMAFVGLRDIVRVDASELAKLYNYNKREYQTFQAAINNVCTIHCDQLLSSLVEITILIIYAYSYIEQCGLY